RASPHRWRTHTHLLDDPTPEIDALTDDVWPEQALRFRVMAAYLMQTRYEDSEPIPETADDPLKAQFTALVEAEVAHSETVLSEFRRMHPGSSSSSSTRPARPRSTRTQSTSIPLRCRTRHLFVNPSPHPPNWSRPAVGEGQIPRAPRPRK